MTEKTKPNQITNFDELIQMYEWYASDLKKKDKKSYWLRYLFRRIPLFAGMGLIFFVVCLALTMTETFGLQEIKDFLVSLRWFDVGCRDWILIGSFVLLLLRSFLPWSWFAAQDKTKTGRKKWETCWEKPATLLLLSSVLFGGFSWIISQEHALLLGLSFFAIVTVGALLADRTLGFTRRNERYQLFANRAEGLIVESRSRGKILDKSGKTIQFNEEHLLECSAFFEALRQDKHNATMSDSFYVLRLKERLLRATTA